MQMTFANFILRATERRMALRVENLICNAAESVYVDPLIKVVGMGSGKLFRCHIHGGPDPWHKESRWHATAELDGLKKPGRAKIRHLQYSPDKKEVVRFEIQVDSAGLMDSRSAEAHLFEVLQALSNPCVMIVLMLKKPVAE